MSGRNRLRTSSGPPSSIAVPQSPADPPTMFHSDAFTRPACSIATQYPSLPKPWPPHCSSWPIPKRPALPIAAMSSREISSFSSISFSCGASVSSTNLRTEVWRSFRSSGRSRSTSGVLQDHSQPLGHALRARRRLARDDHLHRAELRAVHAVRAIDRVLERPRGVADVADAHAYVELVVEAKRRAVLHARLADREVHTTIEELFRVVDPEVTQIRDAP